MVIMLDKCCCGCTLKTGTIIIAVLEMLGAISCLGSSIKLAGGVDELSDADMSQLQPEQREAIHAFYKVSGILGIILAIVSAINLALCIMLIMGANNESPRLIKPWLIYSVVCQVLQCIMYVVFSIIIMVYGHTGMGVLVLFSAAVGTAIAVYFILVVYSFYRQLLGVPYPSKI